MRPFAFGWALPIVLVLGFALDAVASDHLDPPAVEDDPAVDIADIYAFVGGLTDFGGEVGLVPNAVIVMTLVGAPELDVRYSLLFDTDPADDEGGFTVDSEMDVWFTPNPSTEDGTPWCLNFELGQLGVNSCLNPAWHDAETGNYDIFVPLTEILGAGAVQIFSGWRDDPFFFDETAFGAALLTLATWSATYCDGEGVCECPGGAEDTSCFIAEPDWNGTAGAWDPIDLVEVSGLGGSADSYAGRNVYAFVVEAPSIALGATFIRAYAASYRRASRIRTVQGDIERGPWVQLDRMAVPGLSSGLLASAGDEARLLFNRDSIDNSYADAFTASIGTLRTLATRALLAFHQTDHPVPTVAPSIEALLALIDPDVVHLDLSEGGTPPFPMFPNGRTLSFDVMNAVLSLVLGVPVTDGIDVNDVPFGEEFPYLAEPNAAE